MSDGLGGRKRRPYGGASERAACMEEHLETALLEQEKAVNRARCGGALGDGLELLDEHLKAASSSWRAQTHRGAVVGGGQDMVGAGGNQV
jgi:hypothetical protein